MRLITEAIVVLTMLANQVIVSVPVPFTETAQAAEAQAVPTTNYTLTFTTSSPAALALTPNTSSFDADVVAPLRAAQAAQAAAIAAAQAAAQAAAAAQSASQAAATTAVKKAPVIIGGDDAFAKLRFCEAGGDYSKNTGNGYYGAYQYDIRTWGNFGGFARADLAPPSVQDAKARSTQAARGWSPWPSCARKLGLL